MHKINYKQKKLTTLKETQQQNQEYKEYHKFHTRVKNFTPIKFTDNEIKLLNKVLQYNLH